MKERVDPSQRSGHAHDPAPRATEVASVSFRGDGDRDHGTRGGDDESDPVVPGPSASALSSQGAAAITRIDGDRGGGPDDESAVPPAALR